MAELRRKTNQLVPPDSDGRKQIKLHTKLTGNTATQEAVFLPACIFSHPDFFPVQNHSLRFLFPDLLPPYELHL